MDPILTASYGMMAAARQVEQSTHRVAFQGAMADLPVEVTTQTLARHQFSASLVAWKTAEEMQGELFAALR